MLPTLPSIQIEKFDVKVLDKIIRIYELVAEKTNINEVTFNPRKQLGGILMELVEQHQYLEFRFGSSLTHHSKLFLHPVRKKDGLRVAFDFDPNTYDDSRESACIMRARFHAEVQKYLDTLKNS